MPEPGERRHGVDPLEELGVFALLGPKSAIELARRLLELPARDELLGSLRIELPMSKFSFIRIIVAMMTSLRGSD